jgi:hypothetical protein
MGGMVATIFVIGMEVWAKVEPYLISSISHILIFLITMATLVFMFAVSRKVISFCQSRFKEDPVIIKLFVYSSDIIIAVHFMWYLNPLYS